MKYSTINYDSNRPMPNLVKAPLNSDIGVAIKVWKDGQLFDTDLSVDGLSATSTRNGWQLFDLSTGSDYGRKEYEVKAFKEATAYADIEDTCLTGNSASRDRTVNLWPFNLNDTDLAGKTIYAKDVKLYETDVVISTATLLSSYTVPQDQTGINVGGLNLVPTDEGWCVNQSGEWYVISSYIVVDSVTKSRAQIKMPANSNVSVTLKMKVDSEDGFNDIYKLTVVEENENAIEVK